VKEALRQAGQGEGASCKQSWLSHWKIGRLKEQRRCVTRYFAGSMKSRQGSISNKQT
jgi:hypothetical protein